MNFRTQTEEFTFHRMLNMYIEEFGPERVTAIFPENWQGEINWERYLPVNFRVWEHPCVSLRVTDYSAVYDQKVGG